MKFTIKQNRHYSDKPLKAILDFVNLQGYRSFWVRFDESCLYNLKSDNQYDINKLFGLSSGYHHNNSARFGWRSEGNKISLFAYCYLKGNRKSKQLQELEVNQWYKLSVFIRPGDYHFQVENEEDLLISYSMGTNQKFYWGYNLWPYFGGNEKAPHDLFIDLEEFDPYFQEKI